MYKVYFIGKSGQGWTTVQADSKEDAIRKADLKRDETLLTVERIWI